MSKEFDIYPTLYDSEFGHKADDIPFLLEYAKKQKGRVLELGCGTGRVLIPIAETGMKLIGIDNSLNMLKVAKDKIARKPIYVQRNIELVHARMQNFSLKKKFSLIICTFNTFMNMTRGQDQLQVLKNVYRHLERNGLFINEIFIPSFTFKDKTSRQEIVKKERQMTFKKMGKLRYHYNTQILDVNYTYEKINNKGEVKGRYVHSFQLRYTLYPEMKELLTKSGLEIVDVFSDFDKKPFDGKNKMITVSKVGALN